MDELKDLNQQFEEQHAHALELYRRGEYAAAVDEWKVVLTLCAGRPIQEQSVLKGLVDASVQLGEYDEAVDILSDIIKRKKSRGLNAPSGIVQRIEYLKALSQSPPKKRR